MSNLSPHEKQDKTGVSKCVCISEMFMTYIGHIFSQKGDSCDTSKVPAVFIDKEP